MLQFLTQNISAAFTLVGIFIGATLTFASTVLLKRQELKLRLWEKVLDRRIEAHEKVIQLSKTLRTMMSLGYCDEGGALARTPLILVSKENFETWYLNHSEVFGSSSTWLSIKLTRELNLLQDYIVNLYKFLQMVEPEDYPKVGAFLRQDLIDFSSEIERLAFEFFSYELQKLRLNDLRKWHKYPLDKTKKRLAATVLFSRCKELEALLSKRLPQTSET
jgi:hypothetical protein